MTENPYKSLPDSSFWRKSVSLVERHAFDPVTNARFRIGKTEKVATAGSCFAQHISARLQSIGFNYYVVEDGASFAAEERKVRNFGTYSARYGNIYSPRQLRQLLEEALGRRTPMDTAWRRGDGAWVDPLRPNIEPKGFASAEAVQDERAHHLRQVLHLFRTTDVFIFTLGLTEAWRSREDDTIFPLAPGVGGGEFRPDLYEFVNFTVADVEADIDRFLLQLRQINPTVKVLLTVSPVPLIATYEDRHVVCSTTYSKSVLRVAAETVIGDHDWVDYFPSFEIITGNQSRGVYWEDDLREVNAIGVGHAMACFLRHYAETDTPSYSEREAATIKMARAAVKTPTPSVLRDIVCDEEMIIRD